MSKHKMLAVIVALAEEAGALISDIRARGAGGRLKPDGSPVTDADIAAEHMISARLEAIAPDVPVIAEEAAGAGLPARSPRRFWLVDPLDGTREFVAGGEDFTVNIALIEDGRPTCGVVHAPAHARSWWGAPGEGAWMSDRSGVAPIRVRPVPAAGPLALVSRSHADAATLARLDRLGVTRRETLASSLKFCRIAQGLADLYVRLAPTMEWDSAAGDAVLRAAGGRVEDAAGRPLAYGKPGFANCGFVARGA